MKTLAVIYFLILGVLGFGWGWNIYKLVQFSGPVVEMSMLELARIVGIFIPPLGAVLGYF